MSNEGETDELGSIKGKWTQFKGNAKQQWGELTDDDLDKAEGHKDVLAGRIQERYGIEKEEAERQIDEWSAGLNEDPYADQRR